MFRNNILCFLLLSLGADISLGATRIYFSKCGLNGFTCVTTANKKTVLKYECPKGVNDVLILINQFTAPATIEKLTIKNCNTLTISTRCSGEAKPIQYLEVSNIAHLIFQRYAYEPMLPPTVIFENISHIDKIPSRTFTQIDPTIYTTGCYKPKIDFESLSFKNVNIDTIESNAIIALNQYKNFTFINVTVKRIKLAGVQLKINLKGSFQIKGSAIDVVEPEGIQIYTKTAMFTQNQFIEISPSGITGTTENFYFTNNSVEVVHPYGFSILATSIFFLDNKFLHLKSGALEKLSPGLIQETGRNFGKLKFTLDFSKNELTFVDAGSLNPDYVAYENVQTDMIYSRNIFLFCSCENMGWMFSGLGHGPNTVQLYSFYEMVLDVYYFNKCNHPCKLPITMVKNLISSEKCLQNVTLDKFCAQNQETSTFNNKMLNINILGDTPEEYINPINQTIMASRSYKLKMCVVLISGLLFVNFFV